MYMWLIAVALFQGTFLPAVNGDPLNETDAQNFSIDDRMQLFGIDNHADVPDYEFINLDKLIKHQRINKKNSVCFKAFNTSFCIKFVPNKELAGRTHTIEYHLENGTVEKYTHVLKRYTLGTVNNERKSHAAFHDCGRGITGHMKVSNQLFFFNYLPHNLKSPGKNHVIYRRKRRDASTDMVDLGTHELETVKSGIHNKTSQNKESSQEHQGLPKFVINKLRQKTMELMIAADYKMVEFYKPEVLTGYMVAVANIIYGFFQDPSLCYPVKVALVKTVLFKTDMFKAKTMRDLLHKFSHWSVKNNPKDDSDPEHWDNAVLITRNGCEDDCQLEGLSIVTMCSPKSVSVAKDRGLMTAITAVHEISHNLLVGHDGGGNLCKDGLNFMATGTTTGPDAVEWSNCSSKAMEKVLKSPAAKCYNDKPLKKSHIKFRLYGHEYDADKQCQFINGPNYVRCIHRQHRCDRLSCSHKTNRNMCVTIFYPPIDGTYCGDRMWCIHARCVPDGTRPPPPVNGGWSDWGTYTKCTKDCGVGDQWKERKCTNPKPAFGGKACVGATRSDFRTCNIQKCIGRDHPTRLEQCQNVNPKFTDSWYNHPKPCELSCGFIGSPIFTVVKYVLEATRCGPYQHADYSTFSRNGPAICANNTCQKMGCDLILNSGAVLDRCGVCDGDGSTCQLYKGKDTKAYQSWGHDFVTKIPAGAFKIVVKEMKPTWLGFLGFKIGSSPYYALSLPRFSFGSFYNLGGTKIKYYMQAYNYADRIVAKGKISEPISIYYYAYHIPRSASKGISWRYYGPLTGNPIVPTFKWVAKQFSDCNQWCAGGKKYREVICIRTDDGTQVRETSCVKSEKPSTVESCNEENCGPAWHITKWSQCTKSCGKGTKRRMVVCSIKTKTNLKVVKEHFCKSIKMPDVKRFLYCNRKMCPAKWYITTAFSKCTKSCGGGLKYRKVFCKHTTEESELKITSPVECINHDAPLDIVKCNAHACSLE